MAGIDGASDVTRRLFEYWFEEEHAVPGFDKPFRYHFCQREAVETIAWLVEIVGEHDTQKLIQAYATIFKKDLFTDNIEFSTRMDGQRRLRRYVPELNSEGEQELPPDRPASFCLQNGYRFGQDLGDGYDHRLGASCISRCVPAITTLEQFPDRGAKRNRVSTAGEGLCKQPYLP